MRVLRCQRRCDASHYNVTMNVQLKTRWNGPRASVQALRSHRFNRLRDRTLAVDLFHRRLFQVSLASSHRRHVRLTPLSLLSKAFRRWNTIRSTCSHSLPRLSHFRLSREFLHSGAKNSWNYRVSNASFIGTCHMSSNATALSSLHLVLTWLSSLCIQNKRAFT